MHDQRSLICILLLWFSAVMSPAGDCPAADWPAFGRDHTRNAVSPETDPPTDWDVENRPEHQVAGRDRLARVRCAGRLRRARLDRRQ